jgi:Ca2+-transporting ATPase
MVIDPVCSLVFEAEREEHDVMQRAPRRRGTPLFSRALVGWGLLQGLLAFALVGGIFLLANRSGLPADEVRALAFVSLVASIVALILVNRSFQASLAEVLRPNAALGWVLLGVTVTLAVTLAWPAASELFRFGPLHADDLAVTGAAGGVVLVALESLKFLWRRRLRA